MGVVAMTSEACPSGRCRHFGDGHNTHPIRARRTGETPWGWREGVVTEVDGGTATVRYVEWATELSVWHHADLPLAVGDPLRVHEQFRMLETPAGWLCIAVSGGCGPVAAPQHPELWAPESSPAVVDLATGNVVATDHAAGEPREEP